MNKKQNYTVLYSQKSTIYVCMPKMEIACLGKGQTSCDESILTSQVFQNLFKLWLLH